MSRRFCRGAVSLLALAGGSWLTPQGALAQEVPTAGSQTTPAPTAGSEGTEATETPAPAATTPPPTSLRGGPASPAAALDLCALKSHGSEGTYQLQRVVMMNPLVAGNVVDAETETDAKGNVVGQHGALASIHAGELTRLLLTHGFPMQRLYTVYSPALATAAVFDKNRLAGAELADVTGGDSFVAYSVACADWILVPKLNRTSAVWQQVKRKKTIVVNNQSKEVEYLAWDFSVGFALELALFKRGGDGAFAKYTVVTSAGVEGIFAGGGAREPESIPFHEYVSTWPDASCNIGQPEDGKAGGIANCPGLEPKLSGELEPSAADSLCVGVDDAVGASMAKIAACEVSKAMGSAVRVLQLHAKRDPWDMFTQLGPDLSISLGRREGAKRGDYYVAADPNGQGSSGFARITTLGPGGEAGSKNPSRLTFKTGDGAVGSRMTEFPLMGVHLGAHPAAMYLLSSGDLDTTFGYGAVVSLSYDASSYIPLLDEFWARVDLGYLAGSSNEGFIPLDLGVQAGSYVSSGLTLNVGAGFSALVASKSIKTGAGLDESWSGTSGGLFARGTLSHAFSPDWDAALGLEARSGFSQATLKNEKLPGLTMNGGTMTGALALLSLGHTF